MPIFERPRAKAEFVIGESVLFSIQLVLVLSALGALGVLVKMKFYGKIIFFSMLSFAICMLIYIPMGSVGKNCEDNCILAC